ncbi:hypothetical protein THF1C08_150142 [Vibrio jasicida]|uniref:Uncharacterized protein n=1 Tax=Vibrio jasicida TaxID=766224 RepID=A0AAU9QI45_9VIBR|nr:hypothetical protein THF1C08_150142 [Vibrio jasicida]CAH1578997.1 hypothetical protein THF1A12_150144 [Vibrio jasicida]
MFVQICDSISKLSFSVVYRVSLSHSELSLAKLLKVKDSETRTGSAAVVYLIGGYLGGLRLTHHIESSRSNIEARRRSISAS